MPRGWLTLLATDTRGRYVLRMTRAELYDLVWSKPMTENRKAVWH